MTLRKERNFSIVMIIALVLSMILPQVAMAYETIGSPESASLTIHKLQQEGEVEEGFEGTGEADQVTPDGTKPVEGVTFTLTQTHSFDPEENEWTEKAGEPFDIITGEDGRVTVTYEITELGRYKVKETAGPDEIVLNKEEFFVDIPMTNATGDTLNYEVHIYPKNETVLGDVELEKLGEDNLPLAEAQFELYKKATSGEGEDEKIGDVHTTDDEGKLLVGGLEYGDYYFVETKAPEGHTLNNDPVEFTIKDTRTKVEVTKNNYIIPEIEKTVDESRANRGEEFDYTLDIKLPGDIKNYKSFVVTDVLDDRLSFVDDKTDVNGLTFDQTGQTLTWKIGELKKYDGPTGFEIVFTVKIKEDAPSDPIDNKATIDFDNGFGTSTTDKEDQPSDDVTVTPTEGGMKVIKVSKDKDDEEENGDKKLLSGAEFKLTTDKEGNDVVKTDGTVIKVGDEDHTGNLESLVTNKDGEILIEGLTPGTYYLHETKAPTYEDGEETKSYRLLTKPIKVEVKDGVEESYTVENSKSGWNLPTTGGIGTILFTVVGLGFMGIALFMLFRRKKEEA